VQLLLRLRFVDRLNLWLYPLLLGRGKQVFADGTVRTSHRGPEAPRQNCQKVRSEGPTLPDAAQAHERTADQRAPGGDIADFDAVVGRGRKTVISRERACVRHLAT
jgi:hypothetical protein